LETLTPGKKVRNAKAKKIRQDPRNQPLQSPGVVLGEKLGEKKKKKVKLYLSGVC